MNEQRVNAKEAVDLLGLDSKGDLDKLVAGGGIKTAEEDPDGAVFAIADVVICKLGRVIEGLGVDREKAQIYSEAILGTRLADHGENLLDWVENETQELFCQIADNQLARIFLRNKEDSKEVDVGAVKPILFPTTTCEINVFRVIRPVVHKARRVVGAR